MLQNYFELPSEEIFFKIAHRCGILIQETARSDSILARFRLIHCSRASFASKADLSSCQRGRRVFLLHDDRRVDEIAPKLRGTMLRRLPSAAMLAERYVPGLITPELR